MNIRNTNLMIPELNGVSNNYNNKLKNGEGNGNAPDSQDKAIIPEITSNSKKDASNCTYNPRLKSLDLDSATIPESDLTEGRFIPANLLNSIIEKSGKSVILVAAGLGVGKSTASSDVMIENYNGLGVAISHRVKLTTELCKSFKADNYDAVKKLQSGEMVERLGTTAQSLGVMIDNPFCQAAFNGGLLVIDESNSVASEFTGKTIKNEAATMGALRKAINKAKTTLCLDAHIDSSTVSMLEAAGIDKDDMLLIEVIKPELEGYKINIFENELDDKGKSATKPAVINQIITDMQSGKKVMVASLSATFLDTLERQIDKAGLFGAIKITGETKRCIFNSLNADTYGDYQLVMLSPAMSTGISFDKDHADTCYVFLSNNDGTGSYQDGLQAMMRDRSIKSKTINCVYEEGNKPLTTAEQVMIQKDRQLRALELFITESGLAKQFNQVRPSSDKVNTFLWSEMIKQANEKQNFLELFIRECRLKGATIQKCGASEFADGEVTSAVLSADKKEVEQARIDSIVHADKLDDEIELADDVDVKPMESRARIEKFAAVDFDRLPELERVELVNKVDPADKNKSCIGRIRKIERAFIQPKQLKRQVEIAVVGARNDETDRANFAEKITTRKVHWIDQAHYTKLALKAVGVSENDNQLTISDVPALDENSVKGNTPAKALYSSLKRDPSRAITSGMLGGSVNAGDIDAIKDNPFPYMVTLITNLGIKLKKSRGLERYQLDNDSLQFDIDLVNRRRIAEIDESKDWLIKIDDYLKAHQARKAKSQELEQAVTNKVPDSVAAAIGQALERVDAVDLLHDAVDYLEPFHSRIQKKILSMLDIELIVRRFVDSQR